MIGLNTDAITFIQLALFVLPGYAFLWGLGYKALNGFDHFMRSLFVGVIVSPLSLLTLKFSVSSDTATTIVFLEFLGAGIALSIIPFAIGRFIKCHKANFLKMGKWCKSKCCLCKDQK